MIDTQTYKTRLSDELALLTKQLQDLGIHNPQVKEDWIATPKEKMDTEADENEAADRAEDWIEQRGETAVLEARYNNIVRALQKIEDGTYGVCEISGEQIEEARLDANPAARTCKEHMEDEGRLSQ